MCAAAMVESSVPRVGEDVRIVTTLYGGNDPTDPYGRKIRIYPPANVRVEATRTKTWRDSKTNQIFSTVMVRLRDIKTGEEYPEVKMGSLLYAAGLVPEESLEGQFVLLSEMTCEPVNASEPILASHSDLAAMRDLLAEEEAAREAKPANPKAGLVRLEVGELYELERHLVCREVGELAPAGAIVTVLDRINNEFLLIQINDRSAHHVVRAGELYKAVLPQLS